MDPHRLVFADHAPSHADHLARHRLADLFLDTLSYNAHTTASDALWADLTVVTHIDDGFAGRGAASLLGAVRPSELVTRTAKDFEALAIELARDGARLRNIREKLRTNRSATPLFDPGLYARQHGTAYEAIHHRRRVGLPPDHIDIPTSGQ